MKQKAMSLTFALLLLLFSLFLFWYRITVSDLRFQLEDTQISLETSYGRERKQQKEYDEVQAALPAERKKLEELLPKVSQAEREVAELKARRKELRNRIANLTDASPVSGSGGQDR